MEAMLTLMAAGAVQLPSRHGSEQGRVVTFCLRLSEPPDSPGMSALMHICGCLGRRCSPAQIEAAADMLQARRRQVTRNTTDADAWSTAIVSTIAGTSDTGTVDGVGTLALFNEPFDIALTADQLTLVIVDKNPNIRLFTRATTSTAWVLGQSSTVSTMGLPPSNKPAGLFIDLDGSLSLPSALLSLARALSLPR
eukprot:639894-Rhodomonas_salina.3